MNVLQLCPRVPFPPNDGGTIAMKAMSCGLAASGNNVTVLALNTKKHFVSEEKFSKAINKNIELQTVFIDTSLTVAGVFKNLISSDSYHITRFYSEHFNRLLIESLSKINPDVVQLEGITMAVYLETIRKHSKAKIILRAHNVEHIIWERMANAMRPGIKKKYFELLANRLKQFELSLINQVDGIAAITPVDAAQFKKLGAKAPVHVSPAGLDMTEYPLGEEKHQAVSLFHFGSMEWMPNVEGLKWFILNVWPKIRIEFPEMKFYVAGKGMPSWLRAYHNKNIFTMEDVSDPKAFIRSQSVMIVPLLSGSGMRIKILEGLALGKAIISTRIGAEGMKVTDGKNILLADSPEDYLKQVSLCMNDKKVIHDLGTEARKLAEESYSEKNIAQELTTFYKSL